MDFTLNQSLIDSLPIESHRYDVHDKAQRGLFIRVLKNGTKMFYYQTKDKKTTSIGNTDILSLDDVRTILVAKYNANPVIDVSLTKEISLKTFIKKEFYKHIESLKPKTKKDYTKYVEKDIVPKFGKRSFGSVTISEVKDFHQSYKKRPYVGNRILAVLSKIFSLAYDLEYINIANPCKRIPKFKEQSRERYLTYAELAKVRNYLKENNKDQRSIVHALVIEFILISGCRTSESISLRKTGVKSNKLVWEDTKTGKKQLPLTNRLKEIIEEASKYNTTSFVFRKRNHCTINSLSNYWEKIRAKLKLSDVRLHDLRHTFASFAVQAGYSMEHIRDLLGHKNILTTQKYTHLSQNDLMFAMKDVATNMGFNTNDTNDDDKETK